ncbi:MAG: PqqD family protein [Deltaproteobacteria bacterium]|nr:PqqD family protein [Deltaproteobacteria bacterium]
MHEDSVITYRQNPRTAGRVVDGLAFVVTPDDNKLHTLNGTGALIWQLAENGCTLDEIVSAITSRYSVEPERARQDAETFATDLLRRRILETP